MALAPNGRRIGTFSGSNYYPTLLEGEYILFYMNYFPCHACLVLFIAIFLLKTETGKMSVKDIPPSDAKLAQKMSSRHGEVQDAAFPHGIFKFYIYKKSLSLVMMPKKKRRKKKEAKV